MAIKIPSKNIYEINNPKIRDNVIDNVSVEQTVVKQYDEYNTPIYTNRLKEFNWDTSKSDLQFGRQEGGVANSIVAEASSYVEIKTSYINAQNIEINRQSKYSYIDKSQNYIKKIEALDLRIFEQVITKLTTSLSPLSYKQARNFELYL